MLALVFLTTFFCVDFEVAVEVVLVATDISDTSSSEIVADESEDDNTSMV